MLSGLLVRTTMAVLVGAGAMLLYAGAEALVLGQLRAQDARISELTSQLEGLLLRKTTTQAELASMRAPQNSELRRELVMIAASAAASSAVLQERVRGAIVQSAGASITSQAAIQDLPDRTAKLSVLVRARFDETGMLTFVRALESAVPPIFFDSLEVHPVRGADGTSALEFTGIIVGFHSDAD
jgi:hypothetical protein